MLAACDDNDSSQSMLSVSSDAHSDSHEQCAQVAHAAQGPGHAAARVQLPAAILLMTSSPSCMPGRMQGKATERGAAIMQRQRHADLENGVDCCLS